MLKALTNSKSLLISKGETGDPKLSNIEKGVSDILSPTCIPSSNSLVFISLRLAPPDESFKIALFKSDIRPDWFCFVNS